MWSCHWCCHKAYLSLSPAYSDSVSSATSLTTCTCRQRRYSYWPSQRESLRHAIKHCLIRNSDYDSLYNATVDPMIDRELTAIYSLDNTPPPIQQAQIHSTQQVLVDCGLFFCYRLCCWSSLVIIQLILYMIKGPWGHTSYHAWNHSLSLHFLKRIGAMIPLISG